MNRREFIAAGAGAFVLASAKGAFGATAREPMLSYRPHRTGVFDIWLKWTFSDGVEDARIEVVHASGVTGLSFNQRNLPGWHFAGTFALAQDSEILATNRSAQDPKPLAPPKGFEEVRLVPSGPRTVRLAAHEGFSVCELDVGDTLLFTMADGRVRTIELTGTSSDVLERKDGFHVTKYSFTQSYRIDGVERSFTYVAPSDDFVNAVPFEVDGLDFYPDAVLDSYGDAGGFLSENGYRYIAATCRPMRRARLVLQDRSLRLVPARVRACFAGAERPLQAKNCYDGRNCWAGPTCDDPANAGETHCGLDVNMPGSTPVFSPLDFQEQRYLSRTTRGDANNRWRGVRRWSADEFWWFQCHHIDHVLKEENVPIAAGERFALSGAQWCGDFTHSHFNLRVFRRTGEIDGLPAWESHWINPGLFFRQMRADAEKPTDDRKQG